MYQTITGLTVLTCLSTIQFVKMLNNANYMQKWFVF